jgi:hypothetical protein
MIESKVICDDTYSNKSWSIVAQGMSTQEINQMEREVCSYLDWEVTVDSSIRRFSYARSLSNVFFPDGVEEGAHLFPLSLVDSRVAEFEW